MVRYWHRGLLMVVSCALVAVMASGVWAQGRGGRGGPPGGFGGFGGGGGSSLGLLFDPQVREELGIVDEQVEQLRAIGEKMRESMQSQFQGLRDLPAEERQAAFAKLREEMESRVKDIQKEVDGILLPQQRDRLAQIQFQEQVRRSGSLDSDTLKEKLGITDEQQQRLAKLAEEANKEMEAKIAKARTEAREKVLSALTPEQQATFKKLFGEEFQRPNRFGGPGGPGGRGGPPQGANEGT